jgi:hypothetical protein
MYDKNNLLIICIIESLLNSTFVFKLFFITIKIQNYLLIIYIFKLIMVDTQPQMQGQHQSFSKPQSGGNSGTEKIYLIQDIMSKLNRTEPLTFGNFFVDFSEIFPQESDYKK